MTFFTKLVFSSFAFLMSFSIHAQNQTAIVGQATQLKFNISNVVNSKKCHIEVTLPDQTKTSVEVNGPQFLAVVDFIPQKIGNLVIQWEGKNKIRGVNSVFACPGSGVVQLQVNGNAEQIAQKWNQYFSQINDEVKDCVKYGMDLSQFKYQVVADPNTVLTGPDDQKLKPIYEKCENFAKQKHPGKAYSCVLPLENNARSTCDAVYAEKQSDGKLKSITRADAIQLHFDGKPWVIGQNENPDARISRLKQNEENKLKQAAEQAAKLKQDEENKLKQAAEQAAKLEAEEKDRKFKESPEYKKQQVEIERKRIIEEKEAAKSAAEAERKRIIEEKEAAKSAAEAERKRITEEKQAEKIAAELELKRVADEKVATARQEKERKENEIKERSSPTRVIGSFSCTNYGMVDEISKRETVLKGNDVWNISVNGKNGTIITPTGVKEFITYQKSITGPKSSGDIYTVTNSELIASIQIMVDNIPNSSGKSALVTKYKPLANMKLITIGSCTS